MAVAAVLLYHGGIPWARGGFLGVDAFFVLSGFLITSLLLDESARTGTVALARFWSRRARRLLPALLAVVAAVAAFAWFVAAPEARDGIRNDAIATLGYVANWRFIFAKASYFARTAPPSPLRHTWSLAIEEQFYLLWPLLVLAVARGRRAMLRVGALAAGLGAASVVAMVALYRPGQDPSRVYYGSDTRANVILIGAVLAAIVAARSERPGRGAHAAPRWWARLAGPALGLVALAGAAAWGAAVARVDGTAGWLYQGGLPLLAVAVAAVIAHAVLFPRGATAWVLSLAPLRWLGQISYGAYLWHWPLFLTLTKARTGLGGWSLFGLRIGATLAVSGASLFAIELPVRRGLLPRWRAAAGLVTALAVTAAAVVVATGPLSPARATADLAAASGAATTAGHFVPGGAPSRRPLRAPGQPAKVLVVGDSVAATLAPGLMPFARHYDVALDNQGTLGCGLVRGGPYRYFGQVSQELADCEQWPQHWARDVARTDPDVVMVIIGRWEVMDRVHDGRWTRVGDPEFDAYLQQEIEHAIAVLSANRARVAFLTAPYYLRGERPDGGRWPEDDPARVDQFNQLLRDAVGRHLDVASVIEFGDHTSIGGRYTNAINGVQLRYDGVHFTPQGARWLAPWLLPQLVSLAPPVDGAATPLGPSTTMFPSTPSTYYSAPVTRAPRPTSTRPATTTPATSVSTSTFEPPTTTAPPPITTPRTLPRRTTTTTSPPAPTTTTGH